MKTRAKMRSVSPIVSLGVFLLQDGELAISDSVRMVGPGAHLVTIDAQPPDRKPCDFLTQDHLEYKRL